MFAKYLLIFFVSMVPLVELRGSIVMAVGMDLDEIAVANTTARLITGYHKVRKGDAAEGYHQSLIDITPERVLQELNELLAEKTEHEEA